MPHSTFLFLTKKRESIFNGVNILITAGPTREMWDTVRYLSNLSSGKTGLVLAKMAMEAGAGVTLVTGDRECSIRGIKFVHAVTAMDMFEAVKKEIEKCKVFISAAAVSDFRPLKVDRKIKKKDELPVIRLQRNPDILRWAGENHPDKLLVGFSLEDKVDIEKGLLKKQEKKCQIMVLNDVKNLGSDFKTFTLITDNGISYKKEGIDISYKKEGVDIAEHKNLSLEETAKVILEKCQSLL